jgi:hypothetical protein
MPVPFPPGKSGNPSGSLYGSRHFTARMLDVLAENEAAEVFRVIVDAAKAGDMAAAKIFADRVWPVRKGRPIRFDLPEDLAMVESLQAVVRAMAEAKISPEEAQAACVTILAQGRAATTQEVAAKPERPRVVLYLPANGREASATPVEAAPPNGSGNGSTTPESPVDAAPANGMTPVELMLPPPEDDSTDEDKGEIQDTRTPVYEHHGPTLESVTEPAQEPVETTDATTPVKGAAEIAPEQPAAEIEAVAEPPATSRVSRSISDRDRRRWAALAS